MSIESGAGARVPRHGVLTSRRALRMVALVMTAALSFCVAGAVGVYADFRSKIEVSDVSDLVVAPTASPTPEDPDDPYAGKELNILVMGTDYRGDAADVALAGHDDGMRSDTTFVIHVSGDRKRMEVVSIPRDSLVDIPSCKVPDGTMSVPRQLAMFNEAFSIGAGSAEDLDYAAACTITTVQDLTGLTITNHVIVKMSGVVGVVNAIGGVTMCLPEPVHEYPKYGTLDLPAGKQTLDGRTSIEFLRVRHGTGMGLEVGSDLTRITRQQAFLNSAVRELRSKNVLTDSTQLYGVITAVLKSVSADPTLANPKSLVGLAFSLRSIHPSDVVFTELPVVTAPTNDQKVVWGPGSAEVWARLVADEPPPGSESAQDDATADASGDASDGSTAADKSGSADTSGDTASSDGSDDGSTADAGTDEPTKSASPTATPEALPDGVCA